MAVTYRALSALLTYPSAELKEAVPTIRAVLRTEGLVPSAHLDGIDILLDDLAMGDLYDLQERYVLLFDRSRTLSLNLFEHIHGESRDRGGAMVDLLETYRAGGFDLVGPELPTTCRSCSSSSRRRSLPRLGRSSPMPATSSRPSRSA
jgi:nitrate reductase molybdenum cofactor assembly chaperone NarJ/NarW